MTADTRLRGYPTPAAYEEAVLDRVRSVLEERLALLLRGTDAPLPPPADIAEAMAAAIPDAPAPHPYAAMGPFYSSAGVMRLLRIPSKQALDDRRRRGTVLGARTAEGAWVYPAFQFDVGRGRVRPELVPLLAALKGAPRWGAALWLTTEHPSLEGATPLVAAARGRDEPAAGVAALARQYAAAVTAE